MTTYNIQLPYPDLPVSSKVDFSQFAIMDQAGLNTLLQTDYTKPVQHAGTIAGGALAGAGAGAVAGAAFFGTAATVAAGITATNFWNPVGWVAGAGLVLGLGAALIFGSGTGLGKKERGAIIAAWQTAQADLNGKMVEAQATVYAAEVTAMSKINESYLTCVSQMDANEKNLEAVKLQEETKRIDSENVLTAALADAENDATRIYSVDAVNAQANIISANANMVESEGEADADRMKAEARLYDYMN